MAVQIEIKIDPARNSLLTRFAQEVLKDRYLMPGEDFQDLFARVAKAFSNDQAHAQRLYDYMSNLWFMPATPILSNGGTQRGLPISCFLNEVQDSLEGIVDVLKENVSLSSKGGGIGSYWGNVRSINEQISGNGKSSGIIPFLKVQDSMTLAISQGSLRRGSAAVYLPINHPEIEEFIDLRKVAGADINRRSLNLNHGVVIPDSFMRAIKNDSEIELISPATNQVLSKIKARHLWSKLLATRIATGEPYILFIDTVNNHKPQIYKNLGLPIKTSNLCSEIVLTTGLDHLKKDRTAICCLLSVNLEYFDLWQKNPQFILDLLYFLDNVMQHFIENAPDSMQKARYSAQRERSIGLGVMGFHSFLMQKMIPIESVMSKVWNKKIFEHLSEETKKGSIHIATERGSCPDAQEAGIVDRFVHKTAIAPTASISIIAGNCSPGIEPLVANSYTQKTLTGSFPVRNKYLENLLESKGYNHPNVWSSITLSQGSVQHLDFLTQEEKDVFKTAYELDQMWLINLAADRTPYICQSQSLNLFFVPDVSKNILHKVHFKAWELGIKSIYYNRSKSIQRADKVSNDQLANLKDQIEEQSQECLACQ